MIDEDNNFGAKKYLVLRIKSAKTLISKSLYFELRNNVPIFSIILLNYCLLNTEKIPFFGLSF